MQLGKLELLGISIAIVFAMLIWNHTSFTEQETYQQNSNGEDLIRVNYGNQIVIAVKFLNPEVDSQNAIFYVAMDTHLSDLFRYNLTELARLDVDGRSFTPLNWTESSQSWSHHRRGVLEFSSEALKEIKNSRSFRLVIAGIERDRVFQWKLK